MLPNKSTRPSINDILDRIAPVGSLDTHAKILLYGASGVGKTVMSCMIGDRILYVDSIEGWVSLRNHPEIEKKVNRLPYMGASQLEMIADNWDKFDEYDTLVLDEHSTMCMFDLDVVLRKRSSADSTKDPDVPTQPDFFANTERMRRLSAKLLKLPVNVVFTAHSREDEDSGRKLIRPSYMPKLRVTIKEYMHIVGYLTVNETDGEFTRRLQLQPTLRIDAKTRIGGLSNVLVNPDLGQIIKDWQSRGGDLIDDTPVEFPKEPDAVTTEIETEVATEMEI